MRRSRNRVFVSLSAAVAAIAVFAGLSGAARGRQTAAFPAPPYAAQRATAPSEATAVFAGGCFWGIEGVFRHIKGVKSATSGYAGGTTTSPSYEEVSSGRTGHAESVRVVFDPSQLSYGKLLQVFFSVAHDPTQRNRQGPDVGTQYRSIVFYSDDEQKRTAEAYLAQLREAKTFARPIVTEIVPLRQFYPAEDYHQDYMAHHPDDLYIVINDVPKVKHLRQQFPDLYRDTR